MYMSLLEKPDRKRGFKKERILRVLLSHPDGEHTKYRVAKLADVTEPWCREYTERLEEDGLIEDTRVLKPRKLYDTWNEERINPNQLQVSLQQPMQLLTETNLQYGLTTYQAENIHQGLLFTSTTDFYVSPGEIDEWLNIVEDRGMLGGGNTRLRVLDDHVFYNSQSVDGFTTVSIPQLILDLLGEGGPCEEAAKKLIDSFHGDQQW